LFSLPFSCRFLIDQFGSAGIVEVIRHIWDAGCLVARELGWWHGVSLEKNTAFSALQASVNEIASCWLFLLLRQQQKQALEIKPEHLKLFFTPDPAKLLKIKVIYWHLWFHGESEWLFITVNILNKSKIFNWSNW